MLTPAIANLTAHPLAANFLAEESGPSAWTRFWFRNRSSTFAGEVDAVFFYIFWVSAFFFILLMGLLVYFGIKYRRKAGVPIELSPSHNTKLELAWSIIPTLLMVVMFVWGMKVFLDMRIAPGGAEEIYVTARKWAWDFEYANGARSIETVGMVPGKDGNPARIADVDAPVFAVPAGRPTKIILTSSDVLHSFYIPAMRNKRDVFPNRYSTMWFETIGEPTHIFDPEQQLCLPNPDFKGDLYTLFCAEYCGDDHSQMVARIAVLSDDDYDAWLAKQLDTSGIDLLELGKILYAAKGCNSCHSVDGSGNTGPSWTETWAEAPRPGWTDPAAGDAEYGLGVRDDDLAKLNYIRHSILHPAEYYVPGFEGKVMSSYQGQLTDREIRAIATYMKWLDPTTRPEAESESEEEMRLQEQAAAEAEAGGN